MAEVIADALVQVPVGDLEPHPENPRRGNVPAIGESIRRNGFYKPIVAQRSRSRIITGHHSWYAAKDEGLAEVPVVWLDVDDATALRIMLADNRTADLATYDEQFLIDTLAVMDDLTGTGYDEADLAALRAALDKVDPWSNRPVKAMPDAGDVTVGQVWDVGPHRVVCGDSRDPAVWALLPEIDMVFTDPPYGVAYTGGGFTAREVLEGDESPEAAADLLGAVCVNLVQHAALGAQVFVCLPAGGDAFPPLLNVLVTHGLYQWSIVWAKQSATFGRADFHQQHELITYGWNGSPRRVPVEDRTATTLWQVDRPTTSPDHPTAKPVELCAKAIGYCSHPGDVVGDPFCGSGSTLVAAAETGRVGVGIEREPAYAAVTVRRLEEATGVEAVQIA